MKHLARIVLAWGVLCLVLSAGRAEEVDALISQILQGTADDAARARKLVEAAKALEADPAAAVKILELAVECATKAPAEAEGFRAGLDALEALARKAPGRKGVWAQKQADLCRLAYRAAGEKARPAVGVRLMAVLDTLGDRAAGRKDWAEADTLYSEAWRIALATGRRRLYFEVRKDVAGHFHQAGRKLEALRRNAAENPKDARIRDLVLQTLVVDFDDPKRAKQHLTTDAGQAWATYVPLAARDAASLPEAACRELCDWYDKALAAKANPVPKRLMLLRARRYGRRLLGLHPTKDTTHLVARGRLQQIDEQIRQLTPIPKMLAGLRYVDLMKLVDLDLDASPGAWQFVKGAFSSASKSDGTLRFPVTVTGSYRLGLTLAKLQKAPDVNITFPAGGRQVRMTIHEYYARPRSGGRRKGRLARRNVTWLRLQFVGPAKQRGSSQARQIDPGYGGRKWVPYAVQIAVRQTGDQVLIAATLNGQKWLSWAGDRKDLNSAPPAPGGSILVGFKSPGLAVSAAKLRPIDGKVEPARTLTSTTQPAPVPPSDEATGPPAQDPQ